MPGDAGVGLWLLATVASVRRVNTGGEREWISSCTVYVMTERSDISGSSVGLSIYLIDSGTMVSVYTENSAEGTVFGLDFVTKHMVTEANGHQ